MSKNLDQAEKALLEQITHYEQGAAYYAECAARAKEALQHIQSIRSFENGALRKATESALQSKKAVRVAVKPIVAEVPAVEKTRKTAKKKVVDTAPVKLAALTKGKEKAVTKFKAPAAGKIPKTGEDFWLSILAGGECLSSAQIRDTAVARVKEQGVTLTPADLKKLDQRMGFQLATLKKKNIISAEASGQGRTKLYTLASSSPSPTGESAAT